MKRLTQLIIVITVLNSLVISNIIFNNMINTEIGDNLTNKQQKLILEIKTNEGVVPSTFLFIERRGDGKPDYRILDVQKFEFIKNNDDCHVHLTTPTGTINYVGNDKTVEFKNVLDLFSKNGLLKPKKHFIC
jgi:hypothetical protein